MAHRINCVCLNFFFLGAHQKIKFMALFERTCSNGAKKAESI